MQGDRKNSKSLQVEVVVVDAEVVQNIRSFAKLGWGSRRIAAELGIARETARRYMNLADVQPGLQLREKSRRLDDAAQQRALALWAMEAAGNAVVVQRLLAAEGVSSSLRTVQRAVRPARLTRAKKDVATVRFETVPGDQMQIDFGQKRLCIAGKECRVYVFVAVLGYSRRIFAMASLSERQEDWQEGVSKAFAHFGGHTRTLLIDNPKAMVLSHKNDDGGRQVVLHPAFASFCQDWNVAVKACAPSRARTKGKVENAVKYIKHNALANMSFTSFAALQAHLELWALNADRRTHGTLKKRPIDLFETDERNALGSLPSRPIPARTRRLNRVVANDCFVNVDTIRYSVPHQFVCVPVMVEVGETQVRNFDGQACIAVHQRSLEMHRQVVDSRHYEGLWRPARGRSAEAKAPAANVADGAETLADMGRCLDTYGQIVEGATL